MLLSSMPHGWRAAARRLLTPLLLLSTVALGVLGIVLPLPPAQPRQPVATPAIKRRPTEADLLRRACAQAHTNCLVASLVEVGLGPARDPLFSTDDVLRALDTDRVLERSYGELPALRAELHWLGGLTPSSDLGARSWEDVRFLLGCIHGYLDSALGDREHLSAPTHTQPADAYDADSLQTFRGLDFGDLLGLWD